MAAITFDVRVLKQLNKIRAEMHRQIKLQKMLCEDLAQLRDTSVSEWEILVCEKDISRAKTSLDGLYRLLILVDQILLAVDYWE